MHTFSAVAFIATPTLAYIALFPSLNAVALVALLVTLQVYQRFSPKKAIRYHKPMLILLLLALAIPGSWTPAISLLSYTTTTTPFSLGSVPPQTHLSRKTPHSPTLTDYIAESWNKRAGKRNGFSLLTENRTVLQYYKHNLVPSTLIFHSMVTCPKPTSVLQLQTFSIVLSDEELMIYELLLGPPQGTPKSDWAEGPNYTRPIIFLPSSYALKYAERPVLTGLSGFIGGGFEEPLRSGEGSWTKIIGLPYPFSEYKTVFMWVGNLGGFAVALMLAGAGWATQATAAVLPTRASLLAWNMMKMKRVVHGFTGLLHQTQPNDAERGEERRLIEGDGRRDATLLDLDDDEQEPQHQQQSLTYGAVHRG